jgi:hypothetical protein
MQCQWLQKNFYQKKKKEYPSRIGEGGIELHSYVVLLFLITPYDALAVMRLVVSR